jgi:hypothetical protein
MRRPILRARGEIIVRPKSDCVIIPKTQRRNPDSTLSNQFAFETVFRLIALRLTDSRMTAGQKALLSQSLGLRLWRERVDYTVHRSSCALHSAVRDVLRGNRRAFRHVPGCADRPSLNALNAANAKAQREKY